MPSGILEYVFHFIVLALLQSIPLDMPKYVFHFIVSVTRFTPFVQRAVSYHILYHTTYTPFIVHSDEYEMGRRPMMIIYHLLAIGPRESACTVIVKDR
jgi:hypothetical protein